MKESRQRRVWDIHYVNIKKTRYQDYNPFCGLATDGLGKRRILTEKDFYWGGAGVGVGEVEEEGEGHRQKCNNKAYSADILLIFKPDIKLSCLVDYCFRTTSHNHNVALKYHSVLWEPLEYYELCLFHNSHIRNLDSILFDFFIDCTLLNDNKLKK